MDKEFNKENKESNESNTLHTPLQGGRGVAIIKYNAGNVQSVLYALQRIGADAIVTDDIEQIKSADKVIFPGVGHASSAMEYLRERGLDKAIVSLTQPVLGICLGQQLLCKHSEEGDTKCLGIFDTEVKLFPSTSDENGKVPKIPQMGWNNIYDFNSVLFNGLPKESFVYFVHSYYAALCKETAVKTDYILPYSSALQKDNFYSVQFHPEKSGKIGETILKNFISLK
ncbi:MAG: imidazole glycerol phosphate synthase subunit HisH [Sphingobacteriales bacterium]|nr:imidazole glycerol phosphate synthase subunit HisH [Sphingobacteriales bacterium]